MQNSKSPGLILQYHVVYQRVIVQWDWRVNRNSFPASSEGIAMGIFFIMVSVSAAIDSGWDISLAFTSCWLIFQYKSRYILLLLIERILWGACNSSGFYYDPIRGWEVSIIQYLRTKWISRERFFIPYLHIVQIIKLINIQILKYTFLTRDNDMQTQNDKYSRTTKKSFSAMFIFKVIVSSLAIFGKLIALEDWAIAFNSFGYLWAKNWR